jgi:diadenylate cyclase
MRILAWGLQVLIVAVGLYVFLRFLRTTRGSRLVRGLLITSLGGVLGLWALSKALDLEELSHIIQGATGFAVVILAIVFQPELRRAVAQLGGRSFAGQMMDGGDDDTVRQVVRAVTNMASRRHGALIAFERETGLKTYAESGAVIDSAVSVRLLEGIFHPGAALHDGAVIIRGNRVAAAGCIFPLPEARAGQASNQGTRHRAALGLSEETDALVVVVSEETGAVSVCENGRMSFDITKEQLEEQLREALGVGTGEAEPSFLAAVATGLRQDAGWMIGSLAASGGILWLAHQDISVTQEMPLRIAGVTADPTRAPLPGEMLVRIPDPGYRVASITREGSAYVIVTGTRSQFDELGGALAGTIDVMAPEPGELPLLAADITWQHPVLGMHYEWRDERPPTVVIERIASAVFSLERSHAVLDSTELDPRYEVRRDDVHFAPSAAEIVGPVDLLPLLGGELPLRFEPVQLARSDRGEHRQRVRLDEELRGRGLSLASDEGVELVIPIAPAQRAVGTVSREIAVVCLDPARAGELDSWELPDHARSARFLVQTSGLIPVGADPGSQAVRERTNAIRSFVEENLSVFVDIADLPVDGSGRAARVRWTWRRDWRDSLEALGVDRATLGGEESLRVQLESEDEVLLDPRAADDGAEGDGVPGPGESNGGSE